MGRQDEEPNGHGRIRLRQTIVRAMEELFEGNEVAQTLSHLLSVNGNHVVVHPIAHHLVALTGYGLCNLALVMRENQVHSAAVNVKVIAQILTSHGRTLTVPTGEPIAPRTGPAHDMFGHGTLP